MAMYERVSGTYKLILQPFINVSSSWKAITAGYERVGGVWKRFHGALLAESISPGSFGGIVEGYANADYGFGPFGSLGIVTFTDHGSNSRDVALFVADIPQTQISFAIDGAGIPNTDTTFIYLVNGGVVYPRSSASYTASDAGGNSGWAWPSSGANVNEFELY